MAGDETDFFGNLDAAVAFQHAHDGQTLRHQGRLGVFRQGQLLGRALEHQARQRLAERLVDLLKDFASAYKGCGEVLAHADGLGSLAGEYVAPAHDFAPFFAL